MVAASATAILNDINLSTFVRSAQPSHQNSRNTFQNAGLPTQF
jgi:hypothetical protein